MITLRVIAAVIVAVLFWEAGPHGNNCAGAMLLSFLAGLWFGKNIFSVSPNKQSES